MNNFSCRVRAMQRIGPMFSAGSDQGITASVLNDRDKQITWWPPTEEEKLLELKMNLCYTQKLFLLL